MAMMKKLIGVTTLAVVTTVLLTPLGFAGGFGLRQHEYVRVAGGSGYGFCEFERHRRHVSVRLWVTGLQRNSIGTVWIKFDGKTVGQLDGTVATTGGEAEFRGEFRVWPGTTVTLDARDHLVSIVKDIGNGEDDADADVALITELTTPGPGKLGTCTAAF